jgi:hypothetical protein
MTRFFSTMMASVLLAGCYTLQPAGGLVPDVGNQVAFDVNDAGRVALGGSMGPEIGQIEGRLVHRDSGQYTLAVSAVHLLRGGEQSWAGETVHVKNEYIGTSYLRQFSPGRTLALGAVGLVAVTWLARKSLAAGAGDDPTVPVDTSKTQAPPQMLGVPRRVSRPVRLPQRFPPHFGRP